MDEFDLIIIGSGAGTNILDAASRSGMHCALVENGPLGGTCLNRGCIPSKMWIYPADVVRLIQDSKEIGVHASIDKLDFEQVRERAWGLVLHDRHQMEEGIGSDANIHLYSGTGSFIGDHIMQIGEATIHAPKIVISSGARTDIPSIPGLSSVPFLTSENVFESTRLPKSLLILGGGFKACELGHFFSAFGTRTTIIQHNLHLLPNEEPEISSIVEMRLGRHVRIELNKEPQEIRRSWNGTEVIYRDRTSGVVASERAEQVLVCTGERSNADMLRARSDRGQAQRKGVR